MAANAKSKSDGENTANYANPEYDRLFAQLKGIDDGPEKQALIDRMVADCRQQLLQASRWAASETSFASEHVTEYAA